jgi:hypothetical protein
MERQAAKTTLKMRGEVIAELRDKHGNLKQRSVTHNIVTSQGDKFAAAAMYTAAYTGWGMKLGTATTAASKSGAGSYMRPQTTSPVRLSAGRRYAEGWGHQRHRTVPASVGGWRGHQ